MSSFLRSRHGVTGQRPYKWLAVTLLGWVAMTLGLFVATVVAHSLRTAGFPQNGTAAIQALTSALIIVPAVYIIRRRFQLTMGLMPLTSGAILHLLGGAALGVIMAVLGFLITGLLGWITIEEWHLSIDLILSMSFNLCIAFLYEALPEELSLRGIVYSGLRLRLPNYAAYMGQLLLFVLVPLTVNVLQSLVGIEKGNFINWEYVILLVCFGTVLQQLRSLTGSLWASIGFHLSYLEIARFVILQRDNRLLTYSELDAGTGTVVIQFGIIVVGSSAILALLLLWRGSRPVNGTNGTGSLKI
ncbi:CPBP family glutamic-type intramembrane protease [Paenibacillus sp. FSL R7-0273]|uniref:CPBP family glutamic-type intramembrane protease n=1 Tax=Paenibacillus sp. FSL R7-0273 TaxID=1536772 RepID=UPI00063EEAD4|nr:CPBP family glutamic-type intramembrane protease [Paenibacillus sp. FSL R7-0273]OMF89170.1 hypothetical protein BK144_20410 [Paenibacillus sp. FSL R7-0273]